MNNINKNFFYTEENNTFAYRGNWIMKLLIEKMSSQKVLNFRELTKDLIIYKLDNEGLAWKNKKDKFILFKIHGRMWVSGSIWHYLKYAFEMKDIEVGNFIKQRLLKDKGINVKEALELI